MNNNKTIYSSQIDSLMINAIKDTVTTNANIPSTTIKTKESKFVAYNYSYYASPVAGSDTIFKNIDNIPAEAKDEYGTISLDSIYNASKRPEFKHETMFKDHEYQRVSYREKNNVPEYYPAWIFTILLIVSLVIGWIFYTSRVRVQQVFKASFGRRNLNLLFHEGNILKEKIIIPMIASFIVLLSLGIYALLEIYGYTFYSKNTIINYLSIVAIVTIFVMLRHGITYFLGNLFRFNNGILYYLANNICYYFLETMFMLPMLFFLFYTNEIYLQAVVYITIILFSILIISRLFRGLSLILLDSKFSQLYLFSYLCMVEVIPFLIAIKLILL